MPLDTMASAISRTVLSSTFSANLFQLFHPIGGVDARSAAKLIEARENATTNNRYIDTSSVLHRRYRWLTQYARGDYRPLGFRPAPIASASTYRLDRNDSPFPASPAGARRTPLAGPDGD